jgi:hypothetical protein
MSAHAETARTAHPPLTAAEEALAEAEYKNLVDTYGYDRGRVSKVKANQKMRAAAATAQKNVSDAASSTDAGDGSEANDDENRIVRTRVGLMEFTGRGPTHGRFSLYSACWRLATPEHIFRSGTQVSCALWSVHTCAFLCVLTPRCRTVSSWVLLVFWNPPIIVPVARLELRLLFVTSHVTSRARFYLVWYITALLNYCTMLVLLSSLG